MKHMGSIPSRILDMMADRPIYGKELYSATSWFGDPKAPGFSKGLISSTTSLQHSIASLRPSRSPSRRRGSRRCLHRRGMPF